MANDTDAGFQFKFSLEVLNHLGRGLYRSFATVIAEAVSNAWDAEAAEVKITINKDILIVEDNGKGMDETDFSEKFLEVGYSRRQDKTNRSSRNVIGRKGIGKLAMLSISEKVTIISKKKDGEVTGGTINNSELDDEIKKDGSYQLESLTEEERKTSFKDGSGTIIIFKKIKTRLNSEDIIRKYLATQFNFIFSLKKSDSFTIIVNETPISQDDLKELNGNTQFVWYLNEKNSAFSERYKNVAKDKVIKETSFDFEGEKITIKGFVASVGVSSQLLLKGSQGDFKASINLFTNGRLRQEDLFEEITRKTLAEEYVYGEVHVDGFDDDNNDRFTSSREGIIKDDPLYQEFLKELKKIQAVIIQDWTPWRNELKLEGDIDQDKRPAYEVRMEDSRNRREKDFRDKIEESMEDKETKKRLKEKLRALSYKNTMVYQDLFILENIFREYIKIKDIKEEDLDDAIDEERAVKEMIQNMRGQRKAEEEKHALKGKIVKEDHYLNHLYLFDLAEIIDRKINKEQDKPQRHRRPLENDTKEINPVRNAVMHTIEVTEDVLNWDKIKNVIDYIERLKEKADRQKENQPK